MIEIYGNIDVEKTSSAGAISSASIYTLEDFQEVEAKHNNISAEFSDIINNESAVTYISNPFIIGASKLGLGAKFATKSNYFIGNQICNEEGAFSHPYKIRLTGAPYNFTIVFNSALNQHPKTVDVDGIVYHLSSSILQVSQATESGTVEIAFDSWNVGNSPLVIEKIYDGVSLEINKRNLISFDVTNMQRENAELPSWGIISNKGSIEIKDSDKRIYSLAKNKNLTSNSLCYISMRNTLVKGKEEKIATLYTEKWQYDNTNFTAKVAIKDNLEEWQGINIDSINYDYTDSKYYPLSDMYKKLHSLTPRKFNMVAFDDLNEKTKDILENTKCFYPFLKSSTLWKAWYKLCQVCQLYIYKNALDQTICNYEFGA